MGLSKRTYSLATETIERFEQVVPPGKRSAIITDMVREWIERRQREQLRREVIEGCRDMSAVHLEIEQAFHPLEEEVERGLGPEPDARRRRTRPPRSRRGVRAGR